MKKTLFLLSALITSIYSLGSEPFSIKIIDYSLSWTSSMHYTFNNEEMCIVEIDNINKNNTDTLSHRQLLGKEKELLTKYLTIMSDIPFQKEYISRQGGDRNQKRITINLNGEEKSIFISNTYQQDVASFITFINSFIVENRRMKELVDPNKPKQPAH